MNMIDRASRLSASSARGLKAAGIDYVGRYLGLASNWKTMSAEEAQTITSAGLNIVSIWETDPTHASYFSASQGASDAKSAIAYARAAGQPPGTAIYFTVDYGAKSADLPHILEYFQGVRKEIGGYKVGAYGSYAVMKYLHAHSSADYYWQTYAWSGGRQSPYANIYQYQNGVTAAGVTVDRDRILQDPGGWKPMATLLQVGSTGADVKTLQENLNLVLGIHLATDGDFGPATQAAVKSFQQIYHLGVDGIAGPNTLGKLADEVKAKEAADKAPAPTPPKSATPPAQSTPAPSTILAQDLASAQAALQKAVQDANTASAAQIAQLQSENQSLTSQLVAEKQKVSGLKSDVSAALAKYN